MAITATAQQTLDEKLRSESRNCPECSFPAPNPFIERCPRCFAKLPAVEASCPGCIHRMACPAAKK